MTEKKQRFENRLNKDNIKFNTLNPVWDNWQGIALNVFEMIDVMNEQSDELVEYCNFSLHDLLDKKNKEIEQLNEDVLRRKENENILIKTANDLNELIDKLEEENEQLKSDRVRFEEETRLEITRVMDKIFELIDKKIEFYKHKPVSAPISNPINPNFDRDVDRLARLSELQDLKETLKEL